MSHRIYWSLFFGILVLAFALRFYKLGEVPLGFYQDESAIGYNAYSIMQTGRDEYGKSFPLYFKSFGDYKLPIYIYSVIPFVQIFGLTEFAVRFPSALFGFLTVPLLFLLVYELSKNKQLAFTSMLFLAINPWHIHYNRATFEVSISLFLFVLGTWLLVKSFDNRKRFGLFLSGSLCFVTALYTYNLTRLLAPVLYFLTIIFFREKIKTLDKREIIFSAILSVILLVPFFLTLMSSAGARSAGGTFIFSSAAVQAPLLEFRSYFVGGQELIAKVLFNKLVLTLWQYINNIFSYFSVQFFFISGSPHGNHGIGNVGLFYVFELPLIIIGMVQIFIQKYKWAYFLVAWGVIVVMVASLTRDVPHATRSLFLIVPLTAFSAMGFLKLFSRMRGFKNNTLKVFLASASLIFIFFNIFYYLDSYYIRFPIFYAKQWRVADKELSLFLRNNENKYDKIIIDNKAGFIYTSLLFYSAYSPQEFQSTVKREADDSEGFSKVLSFGKYEFKNVDWTKDYKIPHVLIITTPEVKPNEVSPLQTFYYPTRPIVIADKQQLLQYPIQEIPYVLVETQN